MDVSADTVFVRGTLDTSGAVIIGTTDRLFLNEHRISIDHDLYIDAVTPTGGPHDIILQNESLGRVGAGTDAPETRLDVLGDFGISDDGTGDKVLRFKAFYDFSTGPAGDVRTVKFELRQITEDTSEVFLTVTNPFLERGAIYPPGTAIAGLAIPGCLSLQAADGSVYGIIIDDNGTLMAPPASGPTAPINIEGGRIHIPIPATLSDELYVIDPARWDTQVGGGGTVVESTDTGRLNGGFARLRTATGASDFAAINFRRDCIQPNTSNGKSRFRCRFYMGGPIDDGQILEMGLKPLSAWATPQSEGYYVSFDPVRFLSSHMFAVASDGTTSLSADMGAVANITTAKFWQIEMLVTWNSLDDSALLETWVENVYTATELPIPATTPPFAGNLAPGVALYNTVGVQHTVYVDLLEFSSRRP